MLIALDFPRGNFDQQEIAKNLIKDVKGKFTIYMPKTLDDFVAQVKKYRPKKTVHLILLASHFQFLSEASEAKFRSAEYFFQAKGGAVWGENPNRESISYVQGYTYTDAKRLITEAEYNAQRALVYQSISNKYTGRTVIDPHTTVVGFMPTFPTTSNYTEYLLGGLPSDWWMGVSFLDKRYLNSVESLLLWMEDTNVVTIGDDSHEKLQSLNIEHGAFPGLKEIYNNKNTSASKKVGVMLRETARTGEDNRKWRL